MSDMNEKEINEAWSDISYGSLTSIMKERYGIDDPDSFVKAADMLFRMHDQIYDTQELIEGIDAYRKARGAVAKQSEG